MRPNIDLPDGLHGRIKEYKKQRDDISTLDEAYEELLDYGLQHAPYPTAHRNQDLPHSHDRIVPTSKHGIGLNDSLLVAETRFPTSPVVSRTSRQSTITDAELSDILAALADLSQNTSYPSVVATLSQVGGEWYALGAGEIYQALRNIETRWGTQDWDTHKREQVTICGVASDNTKIFVGGQASPSNQPDNTVSIRDPWLAVVTDGYPVTGDEVASHASALNFPTPTTAHEAAIDSELVSDPLPGGPLTIDLETITDEVTYTHDMGSPHLQHDSTSTNSADPWVSAIAIDNPFHRHQLEPVVARTDLSEESLNDILSRDTLLVHLLDHHPLDDEEVTGYRVERLQIDSLNEATGGKSGDITNLSIQARYMTEN